MKSYIVESVEYDVQGRALVDIINPSGSLFTVPITMFKCDESRVLKGTQFTWDSVKKQFNESMSSADKITKYYTQLNPEPRYYSKGSHQ